MSLTCAYAVFQGKKKQRKKKNQKTVKRTTETSSANRPKILRPLQQQLLSPQGKVQARLTLARGWGGAAWGGGGGGSSGGWGRPPAWRQHIDTLRRTSSDRNDQSGPSSPKQSLPPTVSQSRDNPGRPAQPTVRKRGKLQNPKAAMPDRRPHTTLTLARVVTGRRYAAAAAAP